MQWRSPDTWSAHQSALHPATPQAGAVGTLYNFMSGTATIVYVAVLIALAYAMIHSWRRSRGRRDGRPDTPANERRMAVAVEVATGITTLVLLVFVVYDFSVGRAIAAPSRAANALVVNVVGHQWWWEIEYVDTAAVRHFTTANELHVPTGRPVIVRLTSQDVIHSFWMPNLNGKRDLVPGYTNQTWFQIDHPGVYRGQCAEYCGMQHAKMGLVVIAEREKQFDQWYASQLVPARTPVDSDAVSGQRAFMSGACATCHTIRGTLAGGRVGPDLTHFGSRLTLAAGARDNTRGNLGGWITDPQGIKPGTKMPANELSPKDLHAMLSYLEGLK